MTTPNGTASIKYHTNSTGTSTKTKTVRARITAKRVDIVSRVFDRITGKRVSAWHVGQVHVALLGYQLDGESYVELKKDTTS